MLQEEMALLIVFFFMVFGMVWNGIGVLVVPDRATTIDGGNNQNEPDMPAKRQTCGRIFVVSVNLY